MSTRDHLADIAPERIRSLKRAEYERMVAEGLFEDEHIELLEGVIVELSAESPHHAAVIQRLDSALQRLLGDRAAIRVQMPFAAGEASLPEPDLAVVPVGDYDEAHPARAFLIVEVADASLSKDRRLKAEVYAKAGVPEYWVLNLADRVIEVHADVAGAAYARPTTASPGESIRLRAFPDVELLVSGLLR